MVETTIARPGLRRRRSARAVGLRRALIVSVFLLVLAVAVGLGFAGSRSVLPAGTLIAGVDVGGLVPQEARRVLEQRFARVRERQLSFAAADLRFETTARELGVRPDFGKAVADAHAAGGGFGPLRGFKRLRIRLFGGDTTVPVTSYRSLVERFVSTVEKGVAERSVPAALGRKGLAIRIVPGVSGRELDRTASLASVVRSLAALDRASVVRLPVRSTPPPVTAADLAPALADARRAINSPLRLAYRETRWRIPPRQIAQMLVLPSGGSSQVTIGGRGLDRWFDRLSGIVNVKPRDARFAVNADRGIYVMPSREGRVLHREKTVAAMSRTLFSATHRVVQLPVVVAAPARSTEQAKAMGIEDVVASYTTLYSGTESRLHNVALAAKLIDNTLIAPGKIFSFNDTTGRRTVEAGFQEAPVIVGAELVNGIAGGVCQVSTTVFNAAYDSGLPIEERTNHALYISHYPQGRDATVDYPGLDMRFRNDTGAWLLLRTFVSPGRLTVNLYGTPVARKVETETAPLVVSGAIPVKIVRDPTLPAGTRITEEVGSPPRATSVRRRVYDAKGKLLFDTVWRSSYVGEKSVVRVGTKKKPKKAKPVPAAGPEGPAGATGATGATGAAGPDVSSAPDPFAPAA
ncbi:MAG: VanW family protein [Gaiella sp.]